MSDAGNETQGDETIPLPAEINLNMCHLPSFSVCKISPDFSHTSATSCFQRPGQDT